MIIRRICSTLLVLATLCAVTAPDVFAQGCAMCGTAFTKDDPVTRAFSWSVLFLIAMPYTQQLNDKSAIERRYLSGDDFGKIICDQFDVLYKEGAKSGRVLAIAIHPYIGGVPHRMVGFEKALKYISKHKKVWKATGSEIARHYIAQMKGGASAKKKKK